MDECTRRTSEYIRFRGLFAECWLDEKPLLITCEVLGLSRGDITIIGNHLGNRATSPAQRRRFRAFFERCFTGNATFQDMCYALGLESSQDGSTDGGIIQDALIERSISKARFKLKTLALDLNTDNNDYEDSKRNSTTDNKGSSSNAAKDGDKKSLELSQDEREKLDIIVKSAVPSTSVSAGPAHRIAVERTAHESYLPRAAASVSLPPCNSISPIIRPTMSTVTVDNSSKVEATRMRFNTLFTQSSLAQKSVLLTCVKLGLDYEDLRALEDRTEGTHTEAVQQHRWRDFFREVWPGHSTFQQICDALGFGYEEENAVRDATIERSVSKALSNLGLGTDKKGGRDDQRDNSKDDEGLISDAANTTENKQAELTSKERKMIDDVRGDRISSASSNPAYDPSSSQPMLPTAQGIIDALTPQGMTIRSLIGKFKGRITKNDSKAFISTIKAVSIFNPETKLVVPLTEAFESQQKIIEDLQSRNRSLETQVAAATESERKRQVAFEDLENIITKYGDELRALREQIDALKSTIRNLESSSKRGCCLCPDRGHLRMIWWLLSGWNVYRRNEVSSHAILIRSTRMNKTLKI